MEAKFYICEVCGNIVMKVEDKGTPIKCCGQNMKELIPGTTDAAAEKHVAVYEVEGNLVKVTVGSVAHPMLPEHYIAWIAIKTKEGFQLKKLAPGEKPAADFALCDGDEVEEVYAYCNLHSLWKA
ncbi:MAG: desulfoferrodoxin [Clostridiales bacterium]|nr:desulfoferrodoxin [Clostridiales bacterium]